MKVLVLAAAAAVALPAGGTLAQEGTEVEVGAATFTFSGQINQGVLLYDDGAESEAYGPVDNDNSSSRVAAAFETPVAEGLTLGGTFELEYQPYASNAVNLGHQGDPDFDFIDDDLRKLEVFIEGERFGTVTLGQGDTASNESAEADLSGTTVAASSDIEDTAGGQLVRAADGTLTDIAIGDDFDNLDGLSRIVRLRYDAPALLDERVTLSASYGRDLIADDDADQYDVAARFAFETDVWAVEAAAAQAWAGEDATILSGSASVLHEPTGLSATLAAGRQDEDGDESRFGYVKLGYEADFFEAIGPTAISLDHYASADLATAGSTGRSTGLALVQRVERFDAEVYATVRSLDYEDEAGDYEAGTAVLVGARVRF